jgi:hypothetical protein
MNFTIILSYIHYVPNEQATSLRGFERDNVTYQHATFLSWFNKLAKKKFLKEFSPEAPLFSPTPTLVGIFPCLDAWDLLRIPYFAN